MRGRRSRRRENRYFVLRTDGREPEIARISARGAPSLYDTVSGAWVHDPLLGAEIRLGGDWLPAEPEDLPEGVIARTRASAPGEPGRHAGPAPG